MRKTFCNLDAPSYKQLVFVVVTFILFACASIGLHARTCSERPHTFMHRLTTVVFNGLDTDDLEQVSVRWLADKKLSESSHPHQVRGTNSYQLIAFTEGRLQVTVPDNLRSKLRSFEILLPDKRMEVDPLSENKDVSIERTRAGTIIQIEKPFLEQNAIVFDQLGQWLSIFIAFVAAAFLLQLRRLRLIASYALLGSPSTDHKGNLVWFISGLVSMVAGLCFLENRNPLYFVQDDNYVQFLPVMLNGCQSAFQGIAPLYNPFQLLGAPTASVGTYAFSYPITFASYAIASALGQPTFFIDVFAIIHLLAAYVIVFQLLSSYRIRGSLSMCGALCYALSGFFLIAGRSWYYMLPVAVWAPLLVAYTERVAKGKVDIAWTILGSAAVGCYFHSGNAQMWFYSLVFCALTLLFSTISRTVHWKQLRTSIPTWLAGLGICFPLLYLQFLETRDVWRHHDPGDISGVSFLHVLFPFGSWTPQPMSQPFPFETCHFGIVFGATALMILLFALARCTVYKNGARVLFAILKKNVWLLPFFVAVLLAAGSKGVLWDLTSWLPVLNKFTQSAKLLGFVTLFGIIVSALILERVCVFLKTSRKADLLITALSLAGLVFHLVQCGSSFYNFGDAPTYPPLPEQLSSQLQIDRTDINKSGRILSIAPERSREKGYVTSLQHNFPTAYGAISFLGMDLLVSTNSQTLAILENMYKDPETIAQKFGVRWVVVHKSMDNPAFGSVPWLWRYEEADFFQRRLAAALLPKCQKVADLETVTLYRYPEAQPLAFVEASQNGTVATSVDASGMTIDVSSIDAGERIVVAYLARPWLKASLDGVPIEVEKDDLGRIQVKLPRKAKTLSIFYRPPLEVAIAGSLFLILAGGFLAILWVRPKKKQPVSI